MTKLLGLQYQLCYKRGEENQAADTLSRCPESLNSEVSTISVVVLVWLEEITKGCEGDEVTQSILAKIGQLKDGLLHYRGMLWVGNNKTTQNFIMVALHASAIGGHSGFQVTYARICRLFVWLGMKRDIKACVILHCLPSSQIRKCAIPRTAPTIAGS